MSSFWKRFGSHFKYTSADVRRRGLGRWFQILEDHFMLLFWANLLFIGCAAPFLVCLFFFCQIGDILSLAGMAVSLLLMGPGLTALSYVCMQLIRDRKVWLWENFRDCVKREWKQSVAFSLFAGLLWGTFVYALRLIIAIHGGLGIGYGLLFCLNGFLLMGVTIFGYQQIAMVQLPFYGVVKNAFLLIIAGKRHSFMAVLFALLLVGVCLWFYEYCVFYLLLGLPALLILTSNLMFYPAFTALFPEDDE